MSTVYRAGYCQALSALIGRAFTNIARNPMLLKGRLGMTVFFSILLNAMYWQKGDKVKRSHVLVEGSQSPQSP